MKNAFLATLSAVASVLCSLAACGLVKLPLEGLPVLACVAWFACVAGVASFAALACHFGEKIGGGDK